MPPAKPDPKPEDVDSDAEAEESQDENELSANNVTKYQAAAEIANKALQKVIAAAVDGAKVIDLCAIGDKAVEDGAKGVYNKGKVSKGIAFPTCVSPNNIICHLSPLPSDPESSLALKTGDVVRIELGAHVDGYIAQVAHTLVVGASKENPITGRKADVIQAAYTSIEAAIRLLRPGKTTTEVTQAIQKVAEDYNCKPVEGMLSHQLQRNVLDGKKQIILNPSDAQKKEVETHTFEEGEVYSLDILVSSGEGKAKPLETRTTIYKRNPDVNYQLKMKTSRAVLGEINSKCGTMAFGLRQLEDEKRGRMGIIELANHSLVTSYGVLYEKEDAHVAHFMFTVLLMPSGPLKITSFPWDQEVVKSELEVKDEEVKELLKQSVKSKKANKKKKKKAGAAGKEEAADEE
ncbi:Proliferation-associated protein 2G4 [Rhizophlyctis rosea]|nr:Proliferation-associated protein 2G4 [Rhizophlyctis rosea]